MEMPQIQHQPATLYAPKQGTWRFDWYNFNPESNQLQRVRKTFNINRIRDLKQRKSIANSILSQLNQALSNGFNYFVQTNAISENTIETKGEEGISLIAALHRITTIRLLGKEDKTRNCYRSFVNTFENWLKETDQSRMALHEFADTIFYNFLNYKKAKGHGNRNLNDYIGYFKFCFAKLKKLYKLPTNPLEDIDMLPVHASTLFQALTETELAAIKTRLIKDNIRYYCYTLFTAHEYIRPYHIAFIKRSDIDFENSTITINSTSSKNKKVKVKQLMQPVRDMLIALDYHKLPNHYYLFGKDFLPSEKLYKSLSIRHTEIWKSEVIEGLGIDKKMYGLKYTGSSYFVNNNDRNNIDMLWLQKHLEHWSLSQTEQYLRNITTPVIDEKNVNTLKY